MRQGTERQMWPRVLVLGLALLLTAGCDWASFGFDAAHTRSGTDTGPPSAHPSLVDHVWAGLPASGRVSSSPVVVGSTVFVTTSTGDLDAFSVSNTTACDWQTRCPPVWTAALGPDTGATPVVSGGVVYTASGDGIVRAFDAAGRTGCSGTPVRCLPLWQTLPVGPIEASPTIDDGLLYVDSTDGTLDAYATGAALTCADTCTPRFRASLDGPLRSSPVVADGTVVVGSDAGTVAAFDAHGTVNCRAGTCTPEWYARAGAPVRSALAISQQTVIAGTEDGVLHGYALEGGPGCDAATACPARWSIATGSGLRTAVAVGDGTLVTGGDDGALRAFDVGGLSSCSTASADCALRWRTAATGAAVVGAPAIAGHRVYAGWADGRVAGLGLATGEGCSGTPATCPADWEATLGDPPGAPTVAHGRIYVGAGDVHAYRAPVTTVSDDLSTEVLTDDGDDGYEIDLGMPATATATARTTNTRSNTRVAFWRSSDPFAIDESSCATWSGDSSRFDQEGAALRMHPVPGGTKAITVTKNVYFTANWIFNVHVWDTSASPVGTLIAGFDLRSVFYPNDEFPPYPWRLCARVVGNVVSFVVWPLGTPPPAWDDPAYGGSVTLPPGFDDAGRAGWYIGHLRAGDRAGFDDLEAAPVTTDGIGGTPVPGAVPRPPTSFPMLP